MNNQLAELHGQLEEERERAQEALSTAHRFSPPPSAPPINIFQEQDEDVASNDFARLLAEQLTNMQGKDEKNTIPIYHGTSIDQPVRLWLKDAEAVAIVNVWSETQKKRYIS